MDEIIIDETNERISALVSYLKTFADSLEKLRPKPIEKEVELKDGQIYKRGNEYFLLKYSQADGKWDMADLGHGYYWTSRETEEEMMKGTIKEYHFTLCPNAKIHVDDLGKYYFHKE